MKQYKTLLIIFLVISTIVSVGAYNTGGSGVPLSQCNNQIDDDNDGDTDGDDTGCIRPYYKDDTEQNIYDKDLTAQLVTAYAGNSFDIGADKPPLDRMVSIYFYGYVGDDQHGTNKIIEDHITSPEDTLNETYIDSTGGGSLAEWAGGTVSYEDTYDISDGGDFPEGTVIQTGSNGARIIDTPNPGQSNIPNTDSMVGDAQTCGDGIENEGESKTGDEYLVNQPDSAYQTDCRADYGRIQEVYKSDGTIGRESFANDTSSTLGEDEYSARGYCRDDYDNDNGEEIARSCSNGDDAVCSSADSSTSTCTDGSCDSEGEDATCSDKSTYDSSTGTIEETSTADSSWKDDHSSDEGRDYWYTNGDKIINDDCSQYDTWSKSADGGSSCDYDTVTYNSGTTCGPEATECTPPSCTLDNNEQTCSGGDDLTIEGDIRKWSETSSRNCNTFNVVDGGGDDGSGESNHFNEEYPNKPDNDPAGTFTDFKAHGEYSTTGNVWCAFESTLTVDADGPRGNGDGFVVIDQGSVVATESPNGGDTVGRMAVSTDGGDISWQTVDLNSELGGCNGDTACLKYVDMSTKPGGAKEGSAVNPAWDNADDAYQFSTVTWQASSSYSTCKAMNRIYHKQTGNDNDIIECDPDFSSSGTSSTNPGNTGSGDNICGDQPGEYMLYKEGPEIDDSKFESNELDFQSCVDTTRNDRNKDSCVLGGETVREGHVADVNTGTGTYEIGVKSPDFEVCLDVDDYNDNSDVDSMAGDNKEDDIDQEDFGGEWYELDSDLLQEAINNGDISTSDISGFDPSTTDPNRIGYYWRNNQNPSSSQYNEEGGNEGLALEDDCHPDLDGCDDAEEGSQNPGINSGNTFYSFLSNGKIDEDGGPQGNSEVTGSQFAGVIKKVKDNSDQLEPGMDTSYYGMISSSSGLPGSFSFWEDSRGQQDYADQYAYVPDLTYSLSSRGRPYEKWGTYFHPEYRGDYADDEVRDKYAKVFGNSYAAVVNGEGIWIDPDNLKNLYENNADYSWPSGEDWFDQVSRSMDLTRPDSGIGFDVPGSDIEFGPNSKILNGDIYFEGEGDGEDNDGDGLIDENPGDSGSDNRNWEGTSQVGETVTELEPPLCGDEREEFLIEEMGEAENTQQYSGPYACASRQDYCFDGTGNTLVLRDNYRQIDEENEDTGRLKQDEEYCGATRDGLSVWYDQDFGDIDGDGTQETCRTNTLYGQEGVRWLNRNYVNSHPEAVEGGIDDDWNGYIAQHESAYSGFYTEFEADPDKETWTSGDLNLKTPVSSGVPSSEVATKGFCAGDDDGEYLITQQCSNNLCSTNRNIQGVAKVPGSCVIDDENVQYNIQELPDSGKNSRQLFEPGEEVTLDLGNEEATIACFNGFWHRDWPISISQDMAEVPLGSELNVPFEVINVENQRRTFEVEMIDNWQGDGLSAYDFTSFAQQDGKSFQVTVPARSSQTFNLQISGTRETIDGDNNPQDTVELRAETVNSNQFGTDSMRVNISRVSSNQNNAVANRETRNVPGITALQVAVITLFSSLFYFFRA